MPHLTLDDPRYVRALAHPLRVRILAALEERRASPVELAGALGASLGTVAYHVRALHALGLVELVGERRVRGAVQHFYRARARPTISNSAWGQAPAIAKQALLGATLQQVGEQVTAAAAAGGFDRADANLVRVPLRLDEQGFSDLSVACDRLAEEARAIERAATARLEADGGAARHGVQAVAVTMLFEAQPFGAAAPD